MSLFEAYNLIRVLQRKGLVKQLPSDFLEDNDGQGPIQALASRGLVNEQKAIEAISEELGTRIFDLADTDVQKRFTIAALAESVSSSFCWLNNVLPLYEEDSSIIAACVNPLDYNTKKYLELRFEQPIELVICEERKLDALLEQYMPRAKVDLDTEGGADNTTVELASPIKQEQNVDRVQADAPLVVKLVNRIIAEAVRLKASDIHLDTESSGISVRFRIDGILHHALKIPRQHQLAVTSRIKILAGMDIVEKRRPQDGRLTAESKGRKMDIRVSCLPTAYGEKTVMRLLSANGDETTLSNLGFTPAIEKALKEVLCQRGKILLVTGPTGSGKTTTLYAALNFIKDGSTSIQTVEDPIELKIPGVSQVQVNSAAGITFASALRSILRQDPDIIMVGEIRDSETADIAMQAAQTGHLVLSTLHTNNAPSAITRLINLDCKPYIIPSSVAGVLAQRLVRRVCPYCRKEVDRSECSEYQDLLKHFQLESSALYAGRGCPECNGTGYSGRTVVLSYLNISESIADLIAASASISDIVSCATKEGYFSLEDSALDLLKRGITSFDEVKPLLLSAFTASSKHKAVLELIQPDTSPHTVSESKKLFGSQHTMLLVSADDAYRDKLASRLRAERFEVIEAHSGHDAIETLMHSEPRLVLAEFPLTDMNRKDFIFSLRQNDNAIPITLVAFSSVDSEDEHIAALKLGVDDFLSKSLSDSVIATKIQAIMRRISKVDPTTTVETFSFDKKAAIKAALLS